MVSMQSRKSRSSEEISPNRLIFFVLGFVAVAVFPAAVLYVHGKWQLEDHAQEIASHFTATWMGSEGKPIPKYSEIRKQIVFHNREASLFAISGLRGSLADGSWEVLREGPRQGEAEFHYESPRYRFSFLARRPLGGVDYLLYGSTPVGLLFAFLAGSIGLGVTWGLTREREDPAVVPTHQWSTEEIIRSRGHEGRHLEFKSVLRWNRHTGCNPCEDARHASLKTITAFLNSEGGTLLIGVNDEGEPITVEEDRFESEDEAKLHLENIAGSRITPSPVKMGVLEIRSDLVGGHEVLRIDCLPSNRPVFLRDKRKGKEEEERFYKRTDAASIELSGSEMSNYIQEHFDGR